MRRRSDLCRTCLLGLVALLLTSAGAIAQPTAVPRFDDPATDGWDSESFAASVDQQLQRIAATQSRMDCFAYVMTTSP